MVLDARYEKVRVDHVSQPQAVLVAAGIDWKGRGQILGAELSNRESRSSWRDFLTGLNERGLHGVESAVSGGRDGLARFSPAWNYASDKKSRQINKLERILAAKVCQLLRNSL
ncbi:MAG: transposase [Methylocapsa sp.]|nr:transposase [Methylocapsa sp.]